MGNCTGVFGACVGEDPVRKVDKDKIQMALAANNNEALMLQDGSSMLKSGDNFYAGGQNNGSHSINATAGINVNKGQYGNNSALM
jgi:hypothetical protein